LHFSVAIDVQRVTATADPSTAGRVNNSTMKFKDQIRAAIVQ